MNKGIRDYCKVITHSVGDVADVYINVNKNDANLHAEFPLYKSSGLNPINLSLMLTLSDMDHAQSFGKGVRLNFYKKLYQDGDRFYICNYDGRVDEYIRTGDYYHNSETMTRIIRVDNYAHYSYELIDKFGNKLVYNYSSYQLPFIYPSRIEYYDGNFLNISENPYFRYKIMSIENGKGEIVDFFHNRDNVERIEISRNSVLINKILLNYSNNVIRTIEHINSKGETVCKCYVQYNESAKTLEIAKQINDNTTYGVKYTLDDSKRRVISFTDGYDECYYGGKITNISYHSEYSEITDYKGRKSYFFFDRNDMPIYEIDDKARVISYSFDESKKLKSQSAIQDNSPEYASIYSLVDNGYFDNDLNNWDILGTGDLSIVVDNSHPCHSILGEKKLKITRPFGIGEVKAYQTRNISGYPTDIFTFIIWGKSTFTQATTFAKAKVILYKDYNIVTEKEISFVNEEKWQYQITELKATDNYDKIKIEITVKGPSAEYLFDAIQLYRKPMGAFYEYDEKGNPIEEVFGDNVFNAQYTDNSLAKGSFGNNSMLLNRIYDYKGNLEYAETKSGVAYDFDYDDNNNVTRREISFDDTYIEVSAEYEKNYDSELYQDMYKNELDKEYSYYYEKVLRRIKEAQDAINTKTTYNYDDLDRILNIVLSNDETETSKNVSYTYNSKNQIETITLDNGVQYIFDFESISGRLTSVTVGTDKRLVEYTYDDDYVDGSLVYTDRLASQKIGFNGDTFGDTFYFYYDDEDRLSEIKLKKKGLPYKTLCYSYQYDTLGRLSRYADHRLSHSVCYEYDLNHRLIKVSDSREGSPHCNINYLYDNLGEVCGKKTKIKSRTLTQSFSPSYAYRNRNFADFFEGYKYQNTDSPLVYSCFFNQKNKIDGWIQSIKDATVICKNSEGKWTEKRISPKTGTDLIPKLDPYIPCIECMDGRKKLSYPVNLYGDGWKGTVMFWFKKRVSNYGRCLFRVSPDSGSPSSLSVYINNNGELELRLEISEDHIETFTMSNVYIPFPDWNFFALTWNHTPSYILNGKDTFYFRLYLNDESRGFITEVNSQEVTLQDKSTMVFGPSFWGAISAVAFTNNGNFLYHNSIEEYYQCSKEYVFSKDSFDDFSSTSHYNQQLLVWGYDVVTLNNSLISIDGTKPFEFTKRPKVRFDVDRTFEYNRDINRHAYVADGQKLTYNFGLAGNRGSTALRVYITETTSNRQYLFQHKDSSRHTLGLYRLGEALYLQIDDVEIDRINTYNTGLTIPNNVWTLVTLSWFLRYNNDPEYGTVYRFTVDRYYINDENEPCGDSFSVDVPLSFKYSNFTTSVGRKMDSQDPKSSNPLKGQIEMLLCNNSLTSYSILKNYIEVTTQHKKYDVFGRLSETGISRNGKHILSNKYEYSEAYSNNVTRERTTTQVRKETIKSNSETITREYSKYDNNGNVKKIKENGSEIRNYVYDYSGQLIEESIAEVDKCVVFAYDSNGNITSKKIYNGYNNKNEENLISNIKYQYDDYWKDRLVKYGPVGQEKTIEYNDHFPGNPTFYGRFDGEYYPGIRFEWEGRRLTRLQNEETGFEVKYYYNAQGLRVKESKRFFPGGPELHICYYYEDSKLISNGILDFLYDESGSLYGMIDLQDKKEYYYVRDVFGNIVGLIDRNGNIVVKYVYDAYGNILQIIGNQIIGKKNPFRYKGYYYDDETGLYYNVTRYYNPEWGRWLNADDVSYLDPSNGLNL
jgi:RHS repeat-associated protein